MTVQKYCELLEYIKENNSWRNLHEVHQRNRKAIKYVDASFDSRTGLIWCINFRSITGDDDDIAFMVDNQYGIEDMYKWLEEPIHQEN